MRWDPIQASRGDKHDGENFTPLMTDLAIAQ